MVVKIVDGSCRPLLQARRLETLPQSLLVEVVVGVEVAAGPSAVLADCEASEACRRGLKDLLVVDDPR